jgi:hypothetical protein
MAPPKDVLIQARVTAEQYEMIKTAADAQGLAVGAYTRMAAMQFATSPMVNAWVTSYGESPELWLARDIRPHYVLRRLRVGAAGEQAFTIYQLTQFDQLVAVPATAVAYGLEFLKRPERHQFVLEGSQERWFVVNTTHNGALGLVEIVLRPEGTPADVIRRRVHDARDGELVYMLVGGTELRGRADVLSIGSSSCEVRLTSGGKVTVPYANVLAVGSPA